MPIRERSKIVNIDKDRAEAEVWNLDRNPYAKDSIQYSHQALQDSLGLSVDQSNPRNTKFVTSDRRALLILPELQEDMVLRLFQINQIQGKFTNLDSFHIRQREGGRKDINLVAPYFASLNEPFNPLLYSQVAMVMFHAIAEATLRINTQKVGLEVDPEILDKSALTAIDGINSRAKDPEDEKINKVKNRLREIIQKEDGKLSLQAKGATVELFLNGKKLETYYQDENDLLTLLTMEDAEERFKKLMAESEVNGQKWFIQPEEWPEDAQYGRVQKTKAYAKMGYFVMENGGNPYELLTGSYMASAILSNANLNHIRLSDNKIIETPTKPKREKKKKTPAPIAPIQNFASRQKEVAHQVILEENKAVSTDPVAPIKYEGPEEFIFETREAARIREQLQEREVEKARIAAKKEAEAERKKQRDEEAKKKAEAQKAAAELETRRKAALEELRNSSRTDMFDILNDILIDIQKKPNTSSVYEITQYKKDK